MRLALLSCFLLVGCSKPADRIIPTSNKEFKDEVLFTDTGGYTVHRFTDDGDLHYYVTGPGPSRIETSRTEQRGETTVTVHDDVETVK